MASTAKRFAQFIDALYVNTLAGSVTWTEAEPEKLQTELAGWKVLLTREESPGDPIVHVVVQGLDGTEMDRIGGDDLGRWAPRGAEFDGYYDKLADLHRTTKRILSGAHGALSDILTALIGDGELDGAADAEDPTVSTAPVRIETVAVYPDGSRRDYSLPWTDDGGDVENVVESAE